MACFGSLRPARLLLAVALLLLAACSDPSDEDGPYTLGEFEVTVSADSLTIARAADGAVLLRSEVPAQAGAPSATALPDALGWRRSEVEWTNLFGQFVFEEEPTPWKPAGRFAVTDWSGSKLELSAGAARGVLERTGAGVLSVRWSAGDAAANRTVQSFACRADDHFYGLGALVHGTDHRGESVHTWVSEQGIGKIRRGTPTSGFPIQGDIHDAYLSVPFVLSSRGFGLLSQSSRRNLFHLCVAGQSDRFALETWDKTVAYTLFDGPTPAQVLERLTARTGRPTMPPKWAQGPWLDAVGGQATVKAAAKTLRQAKIPASAIWTEDWIGGEDKIGGYHLKYHWIPDTTLYPDLKTLTKDLHAQGIRFLGYFNPFIETGYHTWTEAKQNDYFIKDKSGEMLTFSGVFFKDTTLPDLTDPKVVAWIKGYMRKALDLGFDGWMADYAEWLPVEAVLKNGMTGWEAHNLYPLWWQKLNREVLDEKRPDGDYTFFARSGWAGTGGQAPVIWAGDQQTEFGGYDGMASVIPLCVNMGMSGIPITTHDIGGYSSENTPESKLSPRTKELFFRWTALGAFSAVMRTHHGAKAKENWQWDEDAATLAFFAKYAQLHVALFPYRYSLVQEASQRGLPVMRHPVLHFGGDPKLVALKDQFMLGSALMVAPVQVKGATSRKVYLPRGRWYDFFDGTVHEGQKEHTVAATLEQIPVFVRAGAIVPRFLTAVDTLDKVAAGSGLSGIEQAEAGPLGLDVYLGAAGSFAIYDGTRLTLTHQTLPGGGIQFVVDGTGYADCSGGAKAGCVERHSGGKSATVWVSGKKAFSVAGRQGGAEPFSLKVESAPRARDFGVTFHW